jgi:hypothetical protein
MHLKKRFIPVSATESGLGAGLDIAEPMVNPFCVLSLARLQR